MRRRSLIIFILLNILISLGVAYGLFTYLSQSNPTVTTSQIVITVPILVTSTTNPNATPEVRIITATPAPGTVLLPGDLVEASAPAAGGTIEGEEGSPTLVAQAINPSSAEGVAGSGGVATALPENCILHTIGDGDTPFGVALIYEADPFRLLEVNGLTEETATALQIGDVLIVPLEGCPIEGSQVTSDPTLEGADAQTDANAEATAEATSEFTPTPTVRPTLTLPPTAASAQVEIAEVLGVGNVTTEGVVIRNNGNNVNLNGWTLADADGNLYTFTERILFSNALLTIYSRVGQDTAIALFWNRTAPAFEEGDVLTLSDNQGRVQGSFRVP
jgi:hypothetical protein